MKKSLHYRQLFSLIIISVLGSLSSAIMAPIEMQFLQTIVHNLPQASFVFTIATIGSIIGIFIMDLLSNKFSNKKVLFVFMMLSIFFPILYANVSNILELYGIKFSWVICTAGFVPILKSLLQRKIGEIGIKPGTFYGLLFSIQSLVGMIGTTVGGIIADISGYNLVFYILTVIAIIQFITYAYMLKTFDNEKFTNKKDLKDNNLLLSIKYIFKNTDLKTSFILGTSYNIAWGSKVILYPLIINQIVQSNTMTGFVMSIQGLVAMIALPIIGKIVDKSGYTKVIVFEHLLLAISVFAFGISNSIPLLLLFASLIALGEACNGPAVGELEVKNIPEELRDDINSFQQIYNIVVNIITTALIGILLNTFSANTIITIISSIIFVTFIYGYFVYSKQRKNNLI